jgi:transposase-like protein
MGPKEREIKRRLRVLEHAEKIGNVRMTCRYFGLSRSTFYRWKTKYDKYGESGLGNKSTAARNHPRKVPAEIVEELNKSFPDFPSTGWLEKWMGQGEQLEESTEVLSSLGLKSIVE